MKYLVVDDHPIMRFGVRQLIERTWPDAVVEEAETFEAATARLAAGAPDAIILDMNLPDAEGMEGVARMVRLAQDVPVLVMSLNPESAYASRLLQMGVAGYLPKNLAMEELVTALRRILDGKRYVTPAMAERLLDLLDGKAVDKSPHELLSVQEHRVMLLLAAGKSTTEIAGMMHLSVKTVSAYTSRILQKTGWKNKIELTKYCVENRLTE